jgi:hypothetical protein
MSASKALFVASVTTGKILIHLSVNEQYLGTDSSKKRFLESIKEAQKEFNERKQQLDNDFDAYSLVELNSIQRNLENAISRVEKSLEA